MKYVLSPSNKKLRGYNSLHIWFILELFNTNTNFSASCHVQLWNPIPSDLFYSILSTTDYKSVRTSVTNEWCSINHASSRCLNEVLNTTDESHDVTYPWQLVRRSGF